MRLLFFLFLQLFSITIFAQQLDQTKASFINKQYASQIKIASDSIIKMMIKRKVPGLSVCVTVKGKVIWAQGFGYADVENKTPVLINTKFRIGSVSKTITGVAVGKLLDRGQINLDSPITAYVPYWPQKKYVITVGQVASHVAGIRHYGVNEFYSAVHYNDVRTGMDMFIRDSLQFEPGTKYQYSSYGYNLLSAAVEGASGKSYLEFIQKEIFDPIGMNNSTPDYNDSLISHRTNFYEVKKNKLVNGTYVDNSNKWGSGGFLSTPYDLVKFGNALLKNTLISAKALTTLWTPYKLSTNNVNVYGIGFRIEKDKEGRDYMSHGGTSVGGRTFFVIYPKEEVVMAMTYNLLPPGYDETEFSHIFVAGK